MFQVMDVLAPLVEAVQVRWCDRVGSVGLVGGLQFSTARRWLQVGDASDLTRTALAQLERYAAKGQSVDPASWYEAS